MRGSLAEWGCPDGQVQGEGGCNSLLETHKYRVVCVCARVCVLDGPERNKGFRGLQRVRRGRVFLS